ncbi:hypothetical protein GJ496_001377 [Pomphorhynchus laevis]|nr:hypothetical protein GJ496_001377 [Pomphorhynchus laevis]
MSYCAMLAFKSPSTILSRSNVFPLSEGLVTELRFQKMYVGITEINNECKMLIYEDINQYLFNYQSSKFIECNRTSMEWVLANYPELIADETIVQQRIKPGILSLKSKGNALIKRFFISDGTLLGWYRQCGIILQSKDVDFSMLWTEYDKQIHNTFLGNKDLYLFTEYGLVLL